MGLSGWITLVLFILWINPGGHLDSPVDDWAWWQVFILPIIGFSILIAFLLSAGAVFGIAALLDANTRRKNRKDQKAVQGMTLQQRREYYANKRR
jgi:hypothetical protein